MLKRCAVTIALVLALPALALAADPPGVKASRGRLAPPAPAASIFLKFDGIEGESKDASHPNWVEAKSLTITGCSSVGDVSGTPAASVAPRDAASGQATGRRIHQSLTITKVVDKATPKLMTASTNGTPIPRVRIEQPGTTYELENVLVSSVRGGAGMSSGGDRPTESLTLNFSKCTRR